MEGDQVGLGLENGKVVGMENVGVNVKERKMWKRCELHIKLQ